MTFYNLSCRSWKHCYALYVTISFCYLHMHITLKCLTKNYIYFLEVTEQNTSSLVEGQAESLNSSTNNSQLTPRDSDPYVIPNPVHQYEYVDAYDRTFDLEPESPMYSLPRDVNFGYPTLSSNNQYEYLSNSQLTPRDSDPYVIPNPVHQYQYVDAYDRTFDLEPESPMHSLPRDVNFEYPTLSSNNQYEYPSVRELKPKNESRDPEEMYSEGVDIGEINDGYTLLVRRPLNIESTDYGYTHLINFQKEKGEGSKTEKMKELRLSMNPEDDDYIYPTCRE